MDTLIGFVENIVYIHPETGFTVARLNDKRVLQTIVGIMPSIQPGETLHCQGTWKHHPNHGKQFEVKSFETKAPSDLVGIQKYLESGLVKGIGPVFAKKIVDAFGVKTLEIIDNAPEKLAAISGIGKKKLQKIIACWEDQKSIRQVMIFLRGYGISPGYAQKIFKKYQEDSIKIVEDNPYLLAKEIAGIGFKIADDIAHKLGIDKSSEKRIEAAIEYALWELSNNGHTCYPKIELVEQVTKLLEIGKEAVESCLTRLIEQKVLIQFQDEEELSLIFLPTFFHSEKLIAKELTRLLYTPVMFRKIDMQKAISWAESQLNMQFSEEQKQAIEIALSKKVQIITGGPGTGKSTIVRAILLVMEHLTSQILLAAPTGKAAKRLSQITRRKAHTLHSLLEFDFNNRGFKRNPQNPLSCSLMIVDESSMIDTFLLLHLLKALPSSSRLIFLGDVDQLPSVGPGNILKDLIASEKIPTIFLKKIFRQSAHSKIIVNAHLINEGKFPFIANDKSHDFFFFDIEDPEQIEQKIIQLLTKELPERKQYHPIDDIQVLAPMKKGRIGIENLNVALQQALNPSKHPLFRGGHRYHVGDKVMQIKNNYSKLVFNGDVGRISHIDLDEQQVIVNYDDYLVNYDFNELDEITLAYAVSVHKYQGSECTCVIIPIHTSHFKLLYRNLLYTGVTRGKKMVILLGTKKALAIAVKNNDVQQRYTGLRQFLVRGESVQAQQTMLPGF